MRNAGQSRRVAAILASMATLAPRVEPNAEARVREPPEPRGKQSRLPEAIEPLGRKRRARDPRHRRAVRALELPPHFEELKRVEYSIRQRAAYASGQPL